MKNIADEEMLRIFGRTDPETAEREKKHNDELQKMLEDEFFTAVEEEYEWMRAGRTMLDLKEALELAPAPVVLYGAGKGLIRVKKYLWYFDISPQYLCDRDWTKAKGREYGDGVHSDPVGSAGYVQINLDTLCEKHKNDYILITIVDPDKYLNAYYSLRSLGFSKNQIFAVRFGSSRDGGEGF